MEWRLAAQWAGYTWEEFSAQSGEEQSAVVATYRAFHQIEAVVTDYQNKKAEAAQRMTRRPRK